MWVKKGSQKGKIVQVHLLLCSPPLIKEERQEENELREKSRRLGGWRWKALFQILQRKLKQSRRFLVPLHLNKIIFKSLLLASPSISPKIINFHNYQGKKLRVKLSSRFLGDLLCLGDHFFNTSNHVEWLFRKIVVLSIQHPLFVQNKNTAVSLRLCLIMYWFSVYNF